jgi:superfamily II DNA or RNA helicase
MAQNCNGTLEAVTGFGKTRVGCRAARGLINVVKKVKSVLVTVPRIELQTQWEDQLRDMGISQYCKVLVNNTAAKLSKEGKLNHGYDLCIHDEVHTLPAPEMQHVLSVPRKYTLNLSATVERIDKKHSIILQRFPIFDRINYEEALKNKWISPFNIYNIPVPLSEEDTLLYNKVDTRFKYWAVRVGTLANNLGLMDGNKRASGITAALILAKHKDPEYAKIGGQFMSSLKKRKEICVKYPRKIVAAVQLAEILSPREGILFSLDTNFAEEVSTGINALMGKEVCEPFHSKLGTKKRREVLQKLINKEISLLSTCTALDMGFDHPTLSYALVLSGFSSKLTNIQRIGRVVRLVADKNALVINLYTPDTQEETWLNTRTEGLSTTKRTLEEFMINFPKAQSNVENSNLISGD